MDQQESCSTYQSCRAVDCQQPQSIPSFTGPRFQGTGKQRFLIIGKLLHGTLDTLVVGHFFGWNCLNPIEKQFWHFPLPMFNVAVSKGKVCALVVPV